MTTAEFPKNITALKMEVREHLAQYPQTRAAIADAALVDSDNPTLFEWIRLWLEVRYWQGERIDPSLLFCTVNQDGDPVK